MLGHLGVEVARMVGGEIGNEVAAPRDLLISAGRRTLGEMPALIPADDGSPAPTWICIHNQDFLPMRERLCEMGVHYLLQNALDEESLRRFVSQLLRSGTDQRRNMRLPLGGQIQYRHNTGNQPGSLVDLSERGCGFFAEEGFEPGTQISVLLPSSLGGGEEVEITGTVLRESEPDLRGGHEVFFSVVRFETPDEEAQQRLLRITHGERIGTKITPLATRAETPEVAAPPEPEPLEPAPAAPEPIEEATANRRERPRYDYDRPVQVLGHELASTAAVLGSDLSLGGIRLTGCPQLEIGTRLTLALFGAAREEPILLEATVSRSTGSGDTGLAFEPLTPQQQRQLEKLMAARPLLDALNEPDAEAGRTFVAEVRAGEAA
jgi:hypothetical protein